MMDQTLATPVLLGPALTEQQAREIYRQGEEAVVFALLTLAQKVADSSPSSTSAVTPTTPSAMIPPYLKPKPGGRRKRPGREAGHPGSRRPTPEPNRRDDHRLDVCPDCHGPLTRTNQTRTRITEDIPEAITPVVTEHTIHRDWCPQCQKAVEPVVTDALPGATLGNRTLVLSAWLHYGLGNTLAQIVAVFVQVVCASADLPGASASTRVEDGGQVRQIPGRTGRRSPRSCVGCWVTRSDSRSARTCPPRNIASRRARSRPPRRTDRVGWRTRMPSD